MIQKVRAFLRKRGIKSRMFFAFIALPIGLMVLIFLLYYFISLQIFISKNKQNSQITVSLTEENIRLNTSKIEEQVINLSNSEYIVHLMESPEDYKNIFQTYMKDNMNLEDRKELQIFNAEAKLIYHEKEKVSYDLDGLLPLLDEQSTVWSYDNNKKEIVLLVNVEQDGKRLGYLVCGFKERALSPSFSQVDHKNNALIVVDQKGNYLFGSSKYPEGMEIDLKEEKMNIQNHEYYIESKRIHSMDWSVVHMVAADYLLEEYHNFRNMILIYGVVALIILEMIVAIVYRSIYDPLHNILKTMRTIDKENMIEKTRVKDDGNDEIHEVATNVNELLDRIDELVKTIEKEERLKRETQFQLLQAQINPHFLFNTLNTLHFLALMNDDKPVSEGINALAKLLRNTIVDSDDVVSVKEELENLKNYIIIEKLRFGDLFETVYNVDEDVEDCRILKFLLQPIVENSILHAFEEDREHQILTIRIQRQSMYLKIEIGDNGKGFDKNTILNVNKKLSGIGIHNIQDRIQLMYGEQYSMQIDSVLHKGTIVTLLLPYVKGGFLCIK